MENKKNRPPKFYLGLKITGFAMLLVGIIAIVLAIVISQLYGSDTPLVFGIMLCLGLIFSTFSIPLIVVSFSPEIEKLKIKKYLYIQEDLKDDLTAMADNTADITSEAIKTTTNAVKEGLKNTKYCKNCGEEIDETSVFCNKCGTKQ